MQINWSVVLNVLLLLGVLGAIIRTLNQRRAPVSLRATPLMGKTVIESMPPKDNISSNNSIPAAEPFLQGTLQPLRHRTPPEATVQSPAVEQIHNSCAPIDGSTVMMFLSAKGNRQLAGYELWQTVLAAGFRFGEAQLFHRHQLSNGQGPVMCSLAAATPAGVFDLQNIGAFFVRGLCLFMYASGNPTIDAERFEIMLDTARHLSEGLDTNLLDARRQPLSDASVIQYHQQLNLDALIHAPAMAD